MSVHSQSAEHREFQAINPPGTTQYMVSTRGKVIFAVNPKVMSTSTKMIVGALDRGDVLPLELPKRPNLQVGGPSRAVQLYGMICGCAWLWLARCFARHSPRQRPSFD